MKSKKLFNKLFWKNETNLIFHYVKLFFFRFVVVKAINTNKNNSELERRTSEIMIWRKNSSLFK